MSSTFRLVMDGLQSDEWHAQKSHDGSWKLFNLCMAWGVARDMLKDDVRVIEQTISSEPALELTYHWRERGFVPAYMFTNEEEVIFRLKFVGSPVELED